MVLADFRSSSFLFWKKIQYLSVKAVLILKKMRIITDIFSLNEIRVLTLSGMGGGAF